MYKNVEIGLVKKGMTKGELAKEMGLSPSTMSLKLNGKSEISMGEALKIKNILNSELPIEELFLKFNKAEKAS